MKISRLILSVLGAAMLYFNSSASVVCAAPVSVTGFLPKERLNVKLTALIQGETVDIERDGEVIGSRDEAPQKVRVDNKALLQLYGAPIGSKLVLVDDHSVAYQSGSNDPVDTGISLSVEYPATVITKGQQTQVNSVTKSVWKMNYTAQYVGNSTLEAASLPDNPVDILSFSFSLGGLAKETMNDRATQEGRSFDMNFKHSFSFEGAGNGTVVTTSETASVIVSGKITTAGTATEPF